MKLNTYFDDKFSKTVWQIGKKFDLKIISVGGVVRDFLLNREINDFDFLILYKDDNELKNKIKPFLKDFSENYKLNIVKPKRFETYRLVNREMTVDFSPVEEHSLTENLLSRDLTINSIAFSFEKNEFIDPAKGILDLESRMLKTHFENNFKQDPLRILRLFRFYVYLDEFKIEEKTKSFAFKNSSLLKQTAKERVREELFKIFKNDNGFKAIREMIYPVLSTLFPSFEEIKNIPQNGYHHLDVVNHTLKVVENSFNYQKFAKFFPFFSFKLNDSDKIVLRFAALFHDVGKAKTLDYDENGYTTFRNHQFESGSIVLKELDFLPKDLLERIYLLVRRHMLFLNFMINGYSKKSFRKLINMMREDSILLVLLFLSDKDAARGPLSKGNFEKAIKVAGDFLKFYKEEKEKILNLPKLVSGYDVIKILDIAPSREVGKVLNLIMEKQLENPDFTREEALKLIYSLKKENAK
ncbi:poly(A) polymerase [Thermotomaculum hydrothermale]|uniref:Poly(A) polymerase n=1 Tax=Thermotomaculum hydrothermale TaxID=981385 RepID=A0A7R6PXL8_9BACT|nr:HD domain-containing protein [Thermotomaculum hydrothermale]BBB32600.1 poly(A) polymerase [Thermotomaculum hydrothermale]